MSGGVVVVLSGGGGRGLSHLGVLEVLDAAGVPIERVVGVSSGALAGALYGLYGAAEAQRRVIEIVESPEIKPALRRIRYMETARNTLAGRLGRFLGYSRLLCKQGVVDSRHLMRAFAAIVGSAAFEDLRTPLAVVATDLEAGREVVLGSGPLLTALSGSCAFPPVFSPVSCGGRMLVDSGDVNPLPVHIARRYRPDFTVAVDVTRGKVPMPAVLNGIEVQSRAASAGAVVLADIQRDLADFVIRPRVLRREWTDFTDPESAFKAGRIAAKRRLARLRAGLTWKEILPCRK